MAIIKTQDNEIYTSLKKINEIITTNVIGTFKISAAMNKIAKNNSFNDALKQKLLATLPTNLQNEYHKNNLLYSNTFIIRPANYVALQEKLKDYAKPHRNNYDEIHHIIAGIVILGFVINGMQALVILFPGEKIFIPAGSEHWAIMTDDKDVTVISYKSQPTEKQRTQQTNTAIVINF